MKEEELLISSKSTKAITKVSGTKILGHKFFTITFVDAPGYSSTDDLDLWLTPIINYIEKNHVEYHSKKKDTEYKDSRVHLCLFFMKNFTEHEVKILKKIQKVTHIVPILAKVDLLTSGELNTLKKRIRRISKSENISWLDCYKISQVTFCLLRTEQ